MRLLATCFPVCASLELLTVRMGVWEEWGRRLACGCVGGSVSSSVSNFVSQPLRQRLSQQPCQQPVALSVHGSISDSNSQ